MSNEIGKKLHIQRRQPTAPPTAPAAAPTTAPAAPATAPTAPTTAPTTSDAELKQLGVVVDKAPTKSGGASNARALLTQQVQANRDAGALDPEQKRFLRDAYKELSSSSSLADHLAMRDLAVEQGVASALDEIMRANAERLLPQLLESAHVFAGAAVLSDMQSVAEAMGKRADFDAAVGGELKLALGWAKNDGERADVNALASRLGIALVDDGAGGSGRVYEASSKHHANTVQGGFVSPAPTNGQATLDRSVQVKPESPRRVGVDKEAREYVVFDETVPGVFHGHTQLHPDMQRALVAAGQCTNNGRML